MVLGTGRSLAPPDSGGTRDTAQVTPPYSGMNWSNGVALFSSVATTVSGVALVATMNPFLVWVGVNMAVGGVVTGLLVAGDIAGMWRNNSKDLATISYMFGYTSQIGFLYGLSVSGGDQRTALQWGTVGSFADLVINRGVSGYGLLTATEDKLAKPFSILSTNLDFLSFPASVYSLGTNFNDFFGSQPGQESAYDQWSYDQNYFNDPIYFDDPSENFDDPSGPIGDEGEMYA